MLKEEHNWLKNHSVVRKDGALVCNTNSEVVITAHTSMLPVHSEPGAGGGDVKEVTQVKCTQCQFEKEWTESPVLQKDLIETNEFSFK